MRLSKPRNRAALAVLALAVVAVFVLPPSSASAGSATVPNACANNVTPNFSQFEVTTSGDDGVDAVTPGAALTLSGLSQSVAMPGDIFVAGYNLGLLVVGTNNIPANVRSTIEATNTTQLVQNTNTVGGSPPDGSVTVPTTITDPDGIPGTGDETATDPAFSVSYDDMNWTVGAGGTINYRQESIAAAPPTATNNTLLINTFIGGFLNVQFRCAPGTVAGPDPGVITLIDPAPTFASTANLVEGVPTARAGPDQTVIFGDLVTLDGSASTDPDGEALTYSWTQLSGPAVTLSDPTSATPTFTAATGPATLEFQLEVCDSGALCDTDTVVVTVQPSQAPTSNAGPDQTVTEGDLVTLDGTGSSDPDGQALTYSWTQLSGPAVTLSDPSAVMPTFTAPDVTTTATLEFQLVVCDPEPLCDTDTVVITVSPLPPSTISISDVAVTEGDSGQTAATFTVSLSAPQAAPVTVDFATADGTATAPTDYASTSGTVTFAPGDTAEPVTVQVNGDTDVEPSETFFVNLSNATGNATILDAQGAGVIVTNDGAAGGTVSNACRNSVTANNSQISVDTTATDSPDPVVLGSTVTLSNLTQTANVPGAIFVAGYNLGLLTVGSNTIPATVSTFIEATNTVEGVKQTNFAATSIMTVISDPDGTPSTGDETASDGTFTVVYNDLTFTAGPSGTIEFREDTRTPLSVATGAEVGGIIIRAVIGGFLSVRFACSPGTVTPPDPGTVAFIDPAPAFATTTIQAVVEDSPPTANAGADQTVDEGALVNLDGTGSSDPNGETLTYAWTQTGGPTVTLTGADTATPAFTAPQVGPAGEQLTFSLQVCDEADPVSLCDTDTVVIDVLTPPPPVPPTADAGPDQTVNQGDLVTLDGTGSTDPQGETLTFNWTAPAGITLSDPTSPTPTFTAPTGPASLTFTLEVCNTEPFCDTDTVVINVPPMGMVDAATEVIVSGLVGPSTRKTSKSFVIKVTNDGTTPITITAADITTSVTVNGTATGTVDVAGLPVTLSVGSSKRLKADWNYASGAFAAGDSVVFNACVNVAGDIVTSNDCDTATVTAK